MQGARRIAIVAALASTVGMLMLAASAQAHVAFCKETVNPHGQNVPPAGSTTQPGSQGGINDDGFYKVGTDLGTAVQLQDTDGNVFGVFPSRTKVKYTEANGAEPSVKKIGSDQGQAGAIDFHIKGTGDLVVVPIDGGTPATCPVPPPPK
jgi:opacity protein-like surface antigen